MTLNEIGKKYGTDKANENHDYLRIYEKFLKDFKDNNNLVLLELGVGRKNGVGNSLFMWKEYFLNDAILVGVDILEQAKKIEDDRIKIEIGNAGDEKFLKNVFDKYRPNLIIDDASHKWAHQIIGFKTLFPLLKSGEVYICEDMATSFEPQRQPQYGYNNHRPDAYCFFESLLIAVCGGGRAHPRFNNKPLTEEQENLASMIDIAVIYRHAMIFVKK